MRKPIFESEEEFLIFLKDISTNGILRYHNPYKKSLDCGICLNKVKEKGYIKQSDLEKAREIFYKYIRHEYAMDKKISNYIDELEKEIERLRK